MKLANKAIPQSNIPLPIMSVHPYNGGVHINRHNTEHCERILIYRLRISIETAKRCCFTKFIYPLSARHQFVTI